MTKFPVIRDLVVDRSRMFETLKKIQAWLPVDSYFDMGPGPRQSQDRPGAGLPALQVHDLRLLPGGLPAVSEDRAAAAAGRERRRVRAPREARPFDRTFMGAAAIAQIDLFNTNPIGQMNSRERLDALIAEGGIQVCGNAQNCVKVCPKEIPLTTSIARAGRAATFHILRKWFDR